MCNWQCLEVDLMPQAIPMAIAAFQYAAAAVATTFGAAGVGASLTASAVAGLGAAGITGLAATAISIGGSLAGLGAIAGVSALLQPDVPTVGAQIQTKAGSVIPRTMVMGRTAIGGVLANDTFNSGKDDGVATQFYILSGAGDCGTVEKILVGDDEVTFNAPVNGISRAVGKYAPAMWLCQKSGSWTQTAINFNAGGNGLEAGAQPSEWTTNHRLLGCMTTSLMIGRYNEPIKSNGLNGSIIWVVKAENVGLIDPRTGAAATTWAQKQNPWVWAYSYLKTISTSVSPTGITLAGCDIPDPGIDTASFAYAANVADANNFTIAGEVVLESGKKNETLQGMCQAGGGSYTFRNGKVYATVASVKAVAGYLTNEHIRDDITVAPLAAAQVTPNRIVPKFISEANSWKVIEGSVITNSAFVAEDGTERTTTYEIPYCGGGATQAGKIAALALVNAREPHQFDVPLQPSGRYLALAGDCLQITADLTDWVGQKILVDKITGNGDLTSNIHAVSETDSKYAWAVGQTTTPPDYTASLRVDKTYVATPTDTAWAVTGTQITQGANVVPCIKILGSAAEFAGCGGVVVEYKPAAGATWFSAGDLPYTSQGTEITSVTPNTSYDVRIAYYNQYGVRGTYYQPAAVTTGNLVAGTSADGAAAQTAVDAINDVSILSKDEKPQAIQDWNTIVSEYASSGWVSTASSLGITIEVSNYQNAYNTLSSYLNSLTTAGGAANNWNDVAVNTTINRTTWNTNWQNYYTTKLALQAKINAMQKTNADNAALNAINLVKKSRFDDGQIGDWSGGTVIGGLVNLPYTYGLYLQSQDILEGNKIYCKSGDKLYFGCDVAIFSGTALFGLTVYDVNDSFLNYSFQTLSYGGNNLSYTLPPNAYAVRPHLLASGGNSVFGNIYVQRSEFGADVTASNVAAAIDGQGNQATANALYGSLSARPTSGADRDIYSTSDTFEVFLRNGTGNIWIKIADISPAKIALSKSISGSMSIAPGASGTFTTGTVTVSVIGGTSPYTYDWLVSTREGPIAKMSNPSDNSARASATVADGQSSFGKLACIVTDATGITAIIAQDFTISSSA
jgi:hypothetical protein